MYFTFCAQCERQLGPEVEVGAVGGDIGTSGVYHIVVSRDQTRQRMNGVERGLKENRGIVIRAYRISIFINISILRGPRRQMRLFHGDSICTRFGRR